MKIIKAGTRIHIGCHTGYCGMDSKYNYTLGSDYTEDELSDFAWEQALDNAEGYGIYHTPEEDIDEDDCNEYSSNIEGFWELYDDKKHSGHHEGGILKL